MKKNLPVLLLVLATSLWSVVHAQERYLDEVFSDVTVTSDVPFGTNFSLLPVLAGLSEAPLELPLVMDVYAPTGDTVGERPVVILTHAGDFLPPVINLSPFGDKLDSSVVALCTSFAKRGYVAISMAHRTGWNPASPVELERTRGILEASVRCTQDFRTCVRYLRRQAREEGNPLGIDSTRIAVGGEDAAAFASFNVAFLDDLADAALPKFLDLSQVPPVLVVDTTIWGDVYGTKDGLFSRANHVGYSSDISMAFGLQGGLGDFSWMEAGDPPVVGVQNISEWNDLGIRDVSPGATGDRLFADGAWTDTVVFRSNELGNNDVFNNDALNAHPIVQVAKARSGGLNGMLVLNTPRREGQVQCDSTAGVDADNYGNNGDPWSWYDENWYAAAWGAVQPTSPAVEICRQNLGNPNDAAQAKIYVDTLATYISAHMVLAMGISGTSLTVSIDEELKETLDFKTFPNPTSGLLNVRANQAIRGFELMNLQGQQVLRQEGMRRAALSIDGTQLAPGVYILKTKFEAGEVIEKVVWQ